MIRLPAGHYNQKSAMLSYSNTAVSPWELLHGHVRIYVHLTIREMSICVFICLPTRSLFKFKDGLNRLAKVGKCI
jgi:hypothetical protein